MFTESRTMITSVGVSNLLPTVPSVRRKLRIFRGWLSSSRVKSVGSNSGTGLPAVSITSTSRLMRAGGSAETGGAAGIVGEPACCEKPRGERQNTIERTMPYDVLIETLFSYL